MAKIGPLVRTAPLATLVGLSCLLSCVPAQAEPEHFILAKDGKADAVVVVPGGAPPPVQFAAYELRTHLEQMTGAKFQVVETKPDQGNAIILGENRHARAAGIDVAKLKRDGYIIQVKPDVVHIAGRDADSKKAEILFGFTRENLRSHPNYGKRALSWDFERATLYGVYRFLEELGVRWFAHGPQGTVVPQSKNVSIGCGTIKEEPYFELRTGADPFCWFYDKAYSSKVGIDPEEPEGYGYRRESKKTHGGVDWGGLLVYQKECKLWRLRQRVSTVHIAMNHRPASHTWEERFAESSPEFFALMEDGQRSPAACKRGRTDLCYTNEGVFRETMKDIEAFFSGKRPDTRRIPYATAYALNNGWSPGASYGDTFSLLPADGRAFCHCENCAKLRKGVPPWPAGQSKVLWSFVKRVAAETEKRFPGKKIVCLAYSGYTQPPEGLESLPDNVIIGMCPRNLQATFWRVNPARHQQYMELAKKWHGMNKQPLLIWDHFLFNYFNTDKPGVPMVLPHYIAKYLRAIKPYAKWVYFEWDKDALTMEVLNRYVFTRLTWNPDLDVDEVLDDYFAKRYGPSSPIIQALVKEIEAKSEKIASETLGLPAIWEKLYSQEVLLRYRKSINEAVAKARGTSHEHAVGLFSRHFVGAMEKAYLGYVEQFMKGREGKEFYLRCKALTGPLALDGDVSEGAWERSATREHLFNNVDGEKTQWPTQVRVTYDDDKLYVAFTCLDPETPKRSAKTKGDYVEIFLRPDRDSRQYYWIMVNIDGAVIRDGLCTGGETQIDDEWESNAEAAAKSHGDRWVVEIAIPIEPLGCDPADTLAGETWGANFCRTMSAPPQRKDRFSGSSPVLRGAFHRPDSFGAIMFDE